MGRAVHREHHYAAEPSRVLEMLLDEEFRRAVCAAQDGTDVEVSVSRTDDERAQVLVTQAQAVRGVPSVVTSLVGEAITLRQSEEWTGHDAQVQLTIVGQKGDVSGTTRLVGADSGTTVVIDWEVEVKIPLVGRKIAEIVADLLGDALDAEHRVGQEWLAR